MLITRANRRDHDEIMDLLATNDWTVGTDLAEGVAFIARQGPIIGVVRLIEVAPQVVVIEQMLVHEHHRGKGTGAQLMRAAMNSRGGTLYLCCHAERMAFYERLGFSELAIEDCPDEVVDFFKRVGDHPAAPGHVHHFMKAR